MFSEAFTVTKVIKSLLEFSILGILAVFYLSHVGACGLSSRLPHWRTSNQGDVIVRSIVQWWGKCPIYIPIVTWPTQGGPIYQYHGPTSSHKPRIHTIDFLFFFSLENWQNNQLFKASHKSLRRAAVATTTMFPHDMDCSFRLVITANKWKWSDPLMSFLNLFYI